MKIKFKYLSVPWHWYGYNICVKVPHMVSETYLVDVCDEVGDKYRFRYNGQEEVNEWSGIGNHNTAQFWEYDTRAGRRLNLDPVDQISISNYMVNRLNPILLNDPNGDDPLKRAYRYATKKLGLKGENFDIKQDDKTKSVTLTWGSFDKDGNTVIHGKQFKERFYERWARKGDKATGPGSAVNKWTYKIAGEWNPVTQAVTNTASSAFGRDMLVPSWKEISKGADINGEKLSVNRRITTGISGITGFATIFTGGQV